MGLFKHAHPEEKVTLPGDQTPSIDGSDRAVDNSGIVAREVKDRAPVFVVVLCLFQSLVGLLFGWGQGCISGVVNQVDYLQRFGLPDPTAKTGYSLPSTRQALITSFMGLGALFGSFFAGMIASKTGIKRATLISIVIFIIGVAIETSAQYQWGQIIAGRFISGYGVGSMSMLAPRFQAECSPKHLRGIISSTFQLCCTFGIFFANVVNYNSRYYKGAMQWQIPVSLSMIFACLVFIGICLSPELPRHYLERGNLDQARINLGKLRGLPVGDADLEVELLQMQRDVVANAAMPAVTYFDVGLPLGGPPPPPHHHWDLHPGWTTVDWRELLLLVRSQVLRGRRNFGFLHYPGRSIRHQRHHHLPWSLGRRAPRTSHHPLHRFGDHVHRSNCRWISRHRFPNWSRRRKSSHRFLLYLYRRIRLHLGSPRLGCCGRTIPIGLRQCLHLLGHRLQLAQQLRPCHHYTLHHRCRIREPPSQDYLHLGCWYRPWHNLRLLLCPRDQGSLPRRDRRDVPVRSLRMALIQLGAQWWIRSRQAHDWSQRSLRPRAPRPRDRDPRARRRVGRPSHTVGLLFNFLGPLFLSHFSPLN